MEELVKLLTENNARLTTQVADQAEQIKSLNEQLAYLTKKLFGSSSEKQRMTINYLSLKMHRFSTGGDNRRRNRRRTCQTT